LTLFLIFSAFSANSARRLSTTSSTPPASPAFTMLTYRLSKIFGKFSNDSEKVLPLSTESHIPASASLSVRLGVWRCRTCRPRSRGRPASTSVASWRVSVVRSFCLTFGRRNLGSLISIFICPIDFLPAGALFLDAGAALEDPPSPPPAAPIAVGNRPWLRTLATACA